jgi:hypothetical protein
LGRNFQREKLTRRKGRLASNDNDSPEEINHCRALLGVDGCGARDDTAEKPPWPIDPNEANVLEAGATGCRHRNTTTELRSQSSFDLRNLTALFGNLLAQLRPYVTPETRVSRSGEGLHLQSRTLKIQGSSDNTASAFFNLQTQIQPFAGNELDGT